MVTFYTIRFQLTSALTIYTIIEHIYVNTNMIYKKH